MLILRGTPALSDFRLQKLSSDFKAAGLSVASVYAEFLTWWTCPPNSPLQKLKP